MLLSRSNTNEFSLWMESAHSTGAIALIDKSLEWTSFDVVAKLRGMVKTKKVGHAGTLDPLATGLLIIAFGKATKEIDNFQAKSKEYIAEIKLGATTITDDSEADEENTTDASSITLDSIQSALQKYIGVVQQFPPKYSAKKVQGKKLYELARKNIEVEIKPSTVEIYSFDIIDYNSPMIKANIHCSKGTYIRSLARDLGADLGVGGYLAGLRRSAIGEYKTDDALTIDEFKNLISQYNSI